MIYLDWNATTPLRPEAKAAMLAAMEVQGNPSSVHAEGRAAKAMLERARAQVAAAVGCAPDEVIFTSGATEALNLAILGLGERLLATRPRLVSCATEHPAVIEALARLS